MKKFILPFFLLISIASYSQTSRLWGSYYGGSLDEQSYSVATDASGNVYLSGYTNENNSPLFTTSGGYQVAYGGGTNDAFLAKFDASGNRLWATYYGGSGNDQGYSVAVDVNGDVYLAGYTNSTTAIASGGFPAIGGGYDAFVVKFGSGGNRIWARYFGGTGNEQTSPSTPGIGVTTEVLGSVYLTGSTTSATGIATIGAHQTVYGTNTDAFLVRFDINGAILWSTYYGGAGGDIGYGVTSDGVGNAYVTGSTTSGGSISSPGAHQIAYGTNTDAFVVKFNRSGVRSWGTYYGGANGDDARSVNANGKYVYVSGRTTSAGAISTIGAFQAVFGGGGNFDAFLVQFDTSGTRQWGTYYGGAGDERGYAVTTDAMSNIYLGGRASTAAGIATPDGFQTTYGTNNDAMLVKFDPSGARYCATYLGGAGSEQCQGLAVGLGKIYMAGFTMSAGGIASGGHDNTYGGGGNDDGFLVKFSSCIPVSTIQNNPLCGGVCDGDATANPSGATLPPYSYSWNPGGQTTQTATGLCVGSYTVTASDGYANSGSSTVTITAPPAITTTVNTTMSTCGNSDGDAGVMAGGGNPPYTYSWSTMPVQTTQVASNIPAGTYTVVVSDQDACSATNVATVINSNGPSVSISASTNVTCPGGNNGSATAQASVIVTYVWNTAPVQTTATATGLTAGNYTVTVTDGASCTNTATVTITQPAAFTASFTVTPPTCGNTNGSATVFVSGGTGGYNYGWSTTPFQLTQTATGLGAGTYTVGVQDANLCTVSFTVNVPGANTPTASISSQTNVSCNGGNNGSATVSVSGGIPAYTYNWIIAPAQTTATATGLSALSYMVMVTDGNGCTSTATATITQPPALSTTVSTTNSSCTSNNGTASVSVSGGVPSYSYSWNPGGQTTSTATGLSAGNYTVTVRDGNACTVSSTATVGATGTPTVSISSQTNVLCFGGNNGSATAQVTGGVPTFTYSWNSAPVQTTATATGLIAGSYSVLVTDANMCTGSATVLITQPTALSASVSSTSSSCLGNTGTASVNASGGTGSYTYGWSTAPVQMTATATGLTAGNYTVVVADANSCTTSATVTVSTVNGPTVTVSSQTNVSCNGGNNGSATSGVSGGQTPYSYSWSNGQTTTTATGLSATTYTITVTDANSCTGVAIATITQPTALTASTSTTPAACGNNNGTATASPSGGTPGYTYGWSTSPIQFTATATGLAAGSYTVSITDANGCTTITTATVGISAGPSVSISLQTNVSCNGGSNGSATASPSGGTPAYTYNWIVSPAQTTATATGLSAGSFVIIVTDANGCTSTATATITQPTAITTSTSSTGTACGSSNGTATVNTAGGTPGYTYSWSPGGQTTSTATGLGAGTYGATVTDANGCTAVASATVINTNGPNPSIASQTNVTCNGGNNGSANSSVTGGLPPYTYAWSPIGQTTANATGLTAGTYTLVVADANACTSVTTATITQPSAIAVSVSTTPASCGNNNGSASAVVSGGTPGYSYIWFPGGQTTSSVTGMAGGNYLVTVTDANGCQLVTPLNISSPAGPTVSILSQTNVTCNGGNNGSATAGLSGGTSPFTYAWSPSAQTSSTATGLIAGTYTLTVTDANGCTGTAQATITQPTGMSITMSGTSAACGVPNGSATANVTGGNPSYTYSWTTAPVQTTSTASGLLAGTYSVLVTDASGCTNSSAVTIVNYNGPIASILSQTNTSCFGASDGSATGTATGATPPYTYSWNTTPVQNTQTATGLIAGMYTVTVSDAVGCISIAVVAITQPASVSVTASPLSNASCQTTCCDGTASASSSGGTAPYTYSWSTTPAQLTQNATGLCGGMTYTVCVTDANGCSACDTVLVPFNNTTGIYSTISPESISLFPNPSTGEFSVISVQFPVQLKVYNLFGKLIMETTLNRKQETVNLDAPAGVYFIDVASPGSIRTLKLILQ